jgi:hypothetical protein
MNTLNNWILAAYCALPVVAGFALYRSDFYLTLTCVN